MKKLALVVASMLMGSAMANEPNYNYVQGGILKAEEVDGVKMEGFSFDYSRELTDRFYGFVGYATADDKVSSVEFDANRLQAGLGLRFPINSKIDIFTSVALLRDKAEVSSFLGSESNSENGYGLSAGVRSMLTDAIELSASYTHEDVVESDSYITVSGQYFFNDNFSLGLSHIDNSDGDMNSVFMRYSF